MGKLNINNLDLESKEVSFPKKQKIKKRKNIYIYYILWEKKKNTETIYANITTLI